MLKISENDATEEISLVPSPQGCVVAIVGYGRIKLGRASLADYLSASVSSRPFNPPGPQHNIQDPVSM